MDSCFTKGSGYQYVVTGTWLPARGYWYVIIGTWLFAREVSSYCLLRGLLLLLQVLKSVKILTNQNLVQLHLAFSVLNSADITLITEKL